MPDKNVTYNANDSVNDAVFYHYFCASFAIIFHYGYCIYTTMGLNINFQSNLFEDTNYKVVQDN